MKRLLSAFLIAILPAIALAQPNPTIAASAIGTSLKIDGVLNEPEWQVPGTVENFWSNFPADTTPAQSQTRVKVLYNDEFIYFSAVLLNTRPVPRYVASSLRRDYPFAENDAFGVILDTYNDQTNGYGFYVSAYGVQREEQLFSGVTTDGTWDAKWYSAVTHDSLSWTVEMAIPFKYVRFKEGSQNWNINFVRNDVSTNERSSWAPVPRNFLLSSLAYHGQLQWQQTPEKVKKSYSIIPSVTYTANQAGNESMNSTVKLSLDGKVNITSALN
ncbi:MAG TPA: carbohydrate binding family 9 domain-containing protein, partial [Cyclobacteriaceae bacterium]